MGDLSLLVKSLVSLRLQYVCIQYNRTENPKSRITMQ